MSKKTRLLMISFFLTIAALAAFWQVAQCDFINYDDSDYVTENRVVQSGVTAGGIRWAFTTYHASNWHPLTWLSHMLDVQLFGLNPKWHHLTNLLLHIVNTLLLFFIFHRMTNALWQSFFVATIFAIHPLHVESVAWVAERKDVLSAFFWMLTTGAYIYYVERPGPARYMAVPVFFALGLMAKPMLVTLPFVLLLLDFWPLQRFQQKAAAPGARKESHEPESPDQRKGKSKKKQAGKGAGRATPLTAAMPLPAGPGFHWTLLRPLLWEKIPLFALTALSCIVTYLAQQKGGAVASIEAYPLGARIANAFVSYILYIAKTIWPGNLAVLYPHPGSWPLWQVLGALFLLAAATFMAILRAKRFPYLAVGWLWYVGTLVPVIGIVQVGGHSMADRYTYIPLIGLFIIAAWGIPELLERWRFRKEALAASSAVIFLGLTAATWAQVGYWRNSITLYDHALEVTSNNQVIYNNRGAAYNDLGNLNQAISDFDKAIEIYPKYDKAYFNRGNALGQRGDFDKAISDFDRAIELNPRYAAAYFNRGNAQGEKGRYDKAISDFDRAIELNPNYAKAYSSRGIAYLLHAKDRKRACLDFSRACQLGDCRGYENARRTGICE
jgi:protein O-mannosyl-transferase